jgi:hypothetical protein
MVVSPATTVEGTSQIATRSVDDENTPLLNSHSPCLGPIDVSASTTAACGEDEEQTITPCDDKAPQVEYPSSQNIAGVVSVLLLGTFLIFRPRRPLILASPIRPGFLLLSHVEAGTPSTF